MLGLLRDLIRTGAQEGGRAPAAYAEVSGKPPAAVSRK